jgi:hypothetical protein
MAEEKSSGQTAEQKKAEKAVAKDPEGVAEKGNAEVQKATDEAEAQGYRGVSPDPTPRENYTVAGVTAGKPTPETDEKLAEKAHEGIFGTGRSRRA